ncbi:carbohydrate-binding protein [Allostreptomyces psammosilenae]|uniref:CBM6 domain-containing protein n=1 Tax=Allostreptomyces psammosilenae TaxID=1892865 RepID=A0A853AB79_9ACTN|nr:carbohydrate-binding protein [Allostreptomyces psammosilenae]NYI07622.1 hypothetical protein [Allostreptomyces psammosilenae]
MTAGSNGTPEGDDPFAYLYRPEGGAEGPNAGAQHGGGQQGAGGAAQGNVPRTSYHQATRVGANDHRRQAAAQRTAGGYPQQPEAGHRAPAQPQQPAPAGGRRAARQEPPRRSQGPLIAAIAVVAAVAIGITAALVANNADDGGDDPQTQGSTSPSAQPGNDGTGTDPSESASPSASPSSSEEAGELPSADSSDFQLIGGAALTTQLPGAESANGAYVAGLDQPNAAVLWTVEVPEAGTYRLYVQYSNSTEEKSEEDQASATYVVNGEESSHHMNMRNFNAAVGDWSASESTYAIVELEEGENTIQLGCGAADKCHYVLDRMWLARE